MGIQTDVLLFTDDDDNDWQVTLADTTEPHYAAELAMYGDFRAVDLSAEECRVLANALLQQAAAFEQEFVTQLGNTEDQEDQEDGS